VSKIKKYTPELLDELRHEKTRGVFHIRMPGTVKELILDYAITGTENDLINYTNEVLDLITDTKMDIVFAIGAMVDKVAASPDGEAKQFWAREIQKISSATANLDAVTMYFQENEWACRRITKDYFAVVQQARRDRQELDALKKLMKEQELLNT